MAPEAGVHYGPYMPDNIIILCPNHHVMLDCGVLELRQSDLRVRQEYQISTEYVRYYNETMRK